MSTVTRLNITLPKKTAEALRQNIPLRSRSKFITSAVEEKLKTKQPKRISLEMSLQKNKDFYKQVAKDWSATEVEQWPD